MAGWFGCHLNAVLGRPAPSSPIPTQGVPGWQWGNLWWERRLAGYVGRPSETQSILIFTCCHLGFQCDTSCLRFQATALVRQNVTSAFDFTVSFTLKWDVSHNLRKKPQTDMIYLSFANLETTVSCNFKWSFKEQWIACWTRLHYF